MKFNNLNDDIIKIEKEGKFLKFLYNTIAGRMILKILISPLISKIVGKILNMQISNILTKKYIKKYNIDLTRYEDRKYKSFNDFFTRKIKKIEKNKDEFISIADCKVTCYKIDENILLNIKKSKYSIEELIQDKKLAREFKDGICIVYRLSPHDYHRYIFNDSGIQEKLKMIKGKLHTVKPIAFEKYNVYSENTREVSVLNTDNFGKIVQIEVGAMCVGKINNYDISEFKKYDEKGYFEFGGSTIIQIVQKDRIKLNGKIWKNTKNDIETVIKIGQAIGKNIYNTEKI